MSFKITSFAILLSVILFGHSVCAQKEHSFLIEDGYKEGVHKEKNAFGVFTGTTIVPTFIENGTVRQYMFVPTYGIEYGRRLNSWFYLGLHNELELQNYVISNEAGEELERSYIYVGSVLAVFAPFRTFVLYMGPGYEFTSDHNFRVFKVGMEYKLYRSSHSDWYLAPEISLDWISTLYSTFSFGIVVGKVF